MITLAFINLLISFIDFLLTHLLNPIYSTLMDLGSLIPSLQVPAIIYSTFSLCFYFLPMGTIFTLITITCVLVGTAIILSLVHVVLDTIKRIPFL